MDFNKAKVDGAIYEVISQEQYFANPDAYGRYIAIDIGDGYLYPIRYKNDHRPGLYADDVFVTFKSPQTANERDRYSSSNVINFKSGSTLQEIITAEAKLSAEERSILTTVSTYTKPDILATDSPEMAGLKTAIRNKNIDIDSYSARFGANFNNDKRLLGKSDISLKKLKTMAKALDIDLTLTFSDADEDTVNPMGDPITVNLTSSISGGDIDD